MQKFLTITVFLSICSPAAISNLQAGQPEGDNQSGALLADGYFIQQADGVVITSGNGEGWLFVPDNDITDGRAVVKAKQPLELLPSSTLEKIISLAKNDSPVPAKIAATVTQYNKVNYLFCTNFFPLEQTSSPVQTGSGAAADRASGRSGGDPNSPSILPLEVQKKFSARRSVDFTVQQQLPLLEADFILPGRTGFIVNRDDGKIFSVDALGRSVENTTYRLLPCRILENTEQKMSTLFQRQRFRITGTVTKFKNQYYLLPQQITRIFNYGNLAR